MFFSIQEIILTVVRKRVGKVVENRIAKVGKVRKVEILSFFNWYLQRMEVSLPQMRWEVEVNPFQGSPALPKKAEILQGKNY